MSETLGIGIIGCGNISTTYFDLAPLFSGMEVRACADLNMATARARAEHFAREHRRVVSRTHQAKRLSFSRPPPRPLLRVS